MINRSSTHYIPPLESVTRQHTTMATTTQNRDMTACRYSEEEEKLTATQNYGLLNSFTDN